MFQDREWNELTGPDSDPHELLERSQTTEWAVTTAIPAWGGDPGPAEQPYGNAGAAGLHADARCRQDEGEGEDYLDDEADDDDDFDDDDDLDDDLDDDFDDDADADEDLDSGLSADRDDDL